MSKNFYPAGVAEVINAAAAASALSYKMMLVDSGYTFDNTEAVMTVPSGDEISGTGYTAGGNSTSISASVVSNEALIDNEDEEWVGYSAGQADAAIIYIDKGTYATSIPLIYIDDNFPLESTGGTLEVNTPNGIVGIPYAID